MARDEFNAPTKNALAKRVAYRCSNPDCRANTVGPHGEASKVVNLGVAAHITAASPGGPRYDVDLASHERSAIENGIWLCQNCAKLIDSDAAAFSAHRLRIWKVRTEAETLRSLNRGDEGDNYPQPDSAVHAPIPRISGVGLVFARERLQNAGWQPIFNHWSYEKDERIQYGNGPLLWSKGFHELTDACGTGLAFCKFKYHDAYQNVLRITTAGEVEETECPGGVFVWSWSIQLRSERLASEREFSRLSATLKEELAFAKESVTRAMQARRALAIGGGGLGGGRELVYRLEAERRLTHLESVGVRIGELNHQFSESSNSTAISQLEELSAGVAAILMRARDDEIQFGQETTYLQRT